MRRDSRQTNPCANWPASHSIGLRAYAAIIHYAPIITEPGAPFGISSPMVHCLLRHDFFKPGSNVHSAQDSSVLISGAADTALMAILNDAKRETHVTPVVTFLDQCPTTVEQNRLYANHLGIAGKFISCDARSLHETDVDVILAHNFLLFFDEAGIHSLFEAWSHALKPGGEILMCQTIRSGDGSGPSGYGSREGLTDQRIATMKARASEMGFSPRDVDNIDHVCTLFWTSKLHAHPVSEQTFFSALGKSGFEITTCVKMKDTRNSSPANFSGARRSQSEKYFLTIRKI